MSNKDEDFIMDEFEWALKDPTEEKLRDLGEVVSTITRKLVEAITELQESVYDLQDKLSQVESSLEPDLLGGHGIHLEGTRNALGGLLQDDGGIGRGHLPPPVLLLFGVEHLPGGICEDFEFTLFEGQPRIRRQSQEHLENVESSVA